MQHPSTVPLSFATLFLLLVPLLPAPALANPLAPRAQLDGACTGAGGATGVCVATASCTSAGGTFVSGACPDQPEDVKCCTKSACGDGSSSGSCKWTDACSGTTLTDLCPGPDGFKCCVGKGDGGTSGADGEAGDSSATTKKKNLGEKILAKAKEAKGLPYHWGGGSCSGPTGSPKGFDCSGLVSWAVCKVTGRNLFDEGLRVTYSMYCASKSKRKYKKVKYSKRRPGDAVFFGGACDCSHGADKSGVHHVGLLMDTKSKTKIWNAFKTGTKVRSDDYSTWDEKPCPYVIRFS